MYFEGIKLQFLGIFGILICASGIAKASELTEDVGYHSKRSIHKHYGGHDFHSHCECRSVYKALQFCFSSTGHCGPNTLKSCKVILKNRCKCPNERPIFRLSKCYESFECPQIERDRISAATGHALPLTRVIGNDNTAYGIHLAIMRNPAHWYHVVMKFEADPACTSSAVARLNKEPNTLFRFIAAGERKLLDVIRSAQKEKIVMILDAGVGLNLSIINLNCKVQITQLVDLRRFRENPTSFSKNDVYVIFATDHGIFLSHVPSNCGDFQEILEVKLKHSHSNLHLLKKGLTIEIRRRKGAKKTAPLTVGNHYSFRIRDHCEEYDWHSLLIKRRVFLDKAALNSVCAALSG